MNFQLAAVVLATVFAFAATRQGAAQAPQALAEEMPHLVELSDVPGLAIAVIEEGRVTWSGAFGTLGDPARTAVNEQTVFSAASLSKPVFAYLGESMARQTTTGAW